MTVPQVRTIVLGTFAREGRAPSIAELARIADTSTEAMHSLVHQLADQHALVLDRDGDAIRMAHPFTAAPMAFVVTPADGHDDRRWWGGCAWDSFGISAALRLNVRIDTACPHCGAHLAYLAGPHTPPPADLAVRFPRPAREWWDDVVDTCTRIRTFCNHDHAATWTATHAPGTGHITEATRVWHLAQPWYSDRLDPAYAPHTREHNQQLLESCGLTGDFWHLP